MVSLTLAVSKELKKRMNAFPEINWSATARTSIEKRLEFLEKLREFTKDSEMTEKDAINLGKLIKRNMSEHFIREAHNRRQHHDSSTNKTGTNGKANSRR